MSYILDALKKAYQLPRKINTSARTMVVITDGYVTVEKEAFQLIENNLNKANVVSFGIGNGVNRFLIEGMAKVGQSNSFIATSKEEAYKVSKTFKKYISSPLLTQIKLKQNNFEMYDVSPKSIPDVFSDRPIMIYGKYKGTATGCIEISGYQGTTKVIKTIKIKNSSLSSNNKVLKYLWARKKIEQFRKREELEIKNLEKFVLSQERDSYVGVQDRIDKIKQKYQALRDQKIRERVEQLGIKVEEGEDRSSLLEKERHYNQGRQKIEFALESFYRSAHSLCFQINKRYIPKYLNILRVIDRRFETGEIFIKWDDALDEDWLILIYIKNNSPSEGIVIEDKSNSEKYASHEFKTNEIFRASDLMVDSLTNLLDRERKKRKAN